MAIGLLASLVTLVGILLTAQNIAREKEIGTLEQLNVTPITRGQFIAGKLIPFWVLGLIELTVGLCVIRFAFGIPFAGPVAVVYLGAAVYLVAALGLGLLVSTAVQTQQQAMFVTFFMLVTFFFLGGIFTPVESMPGWAQTLARGQPDQALRGAPADRPHPRRRPRRRRAEASARWRPSRRSCSPLALVRYRKTAA